MLNLQNTQLIHIVSELVCIVTIIIYVNIKTKKLNTKIQILEYEVKTANTKIAILHNMIDDILQLFNPEIRNKFKEKYRIQRPPISQNEINNTNMRPPINTVNNKPQQPVRKQINPLESIMSMVGPMMSSMMVSGYDNESPSPKQEKPVIIEEDDNNNDIENELNELEKLEVESKIQENDNTETNKQETVTSDESVDKTDESVEKANKLLKSTKDDKDNVSINTERQSTETTKSPMIQEVNE